MIPDNNRSPIQNRPSKENNNEFGFWKPLILVVMLLFVIIVFTYGYSLTPQYQQAETNHQKQLQQMSCSELFKAIHDNIPRGFTVGGQDAVQEDYVNAFQVKGCIPK